MPYTKRTNYRFSHAGLASFTCAFAASSAGAADAADWLETVGRLHPSMIHFAIALILTAVFFEFIRIVTRRDRPSPAALGCLLVSIGGAAAAISTGWIHAEAAGFAGDDSVELHRWFGIAASSLALLSLLFGAFAARGDRPRSRRGYVLLLVLAAASVGFTGHEGGEITHGKGWVFEPILGTAASNEPVVALDQPEVMPEVVSFERDLLPIFEQTCFKCHGEEKQNGKLRLDSLAALQASPYYDEVVIAGQPEVSPLYERLILPPSDRDFMPKRGEPLPDWQIDMIRKWIEGQAENAGSAPNQPFSTDPAPVEPIEDPDDQAEQAQAHRAVIDAVMALGGHASFESAQSFDLVVNFGVLSRPIQLGDIEALLPVAGSIVELNIGGLDATDEILVAVGRLVGLERLNISRADISDAGLASLEPLEDLAVLNMYGTPITNAAVEHLVNMPALKRVYIWQTSIDESGVAQLQASDPDLRVITGTEISSPSEDEPPEATPEDGEEDDESPQTSPESTDGDG